jgi:hypothetical protein
MRQVFISYARADLSPVQQLEGALQAQGIAVWRDQESIYGGQQWPPVERWQTWVAVFRGCADDRHAGR